MLQSADNWRDELTVNVEGVIQPWNPSVVGKYVCVYDNIVFLTFSSCSICWLLVGFFFFFVHFFFLSTYFSWLLCLFFFQMDEKIKQITTAWKIKNQDR
jgi:hypothetical protein